MDIEIGQLIDSRPLSGLQIRVVILCALVLLLDGYDIQTMGLAVPAIAAAWHLAPSNFWLVQSAALIGMGFGAAFLAPLGDRFGRRPVVIGFVAVVGVASLITASSASLSGFVIWRILTGLGLGASIANATALTSEFMPARLHTRLVTLMFCNVALGAFAAGFTAPALIAAFGWRSLFVVGGAVPLVLAGGLTLALPESIRFLTLHRAGHAALVPILARIAPNVDAGTVVAAARDRSARRSVLELLSSKLRARTLLLWCLFCLNLGVVYFLLSWLPTLLGSAGWSRAEALRGAALFQLGGVAGGLTAAWLADRGAMVRGLVGAYVLAAAALLAFLAAPHELGLWFGLIFLLGGGISGAQLTLYALAAYFYPAAIRATGLGWTATVSRIGTVGGTMAGGWLLALGLTPAGILGLLIVPTLICAVVVLGLPRAVRPA